MIDDLSLNSDSTLPPTPHQPPSASESVGIADGSWSHASEAVPLDDLVESSPESSSHSMGSAIHGSEPRASETGLVVVSSPEQETRDESAGRDKSGGGFDFGKVLSQVETSIKEHPLLWAGGALVAGWLLGGTLSKGGGSPAGSKGAEGSAGTAPPPPSDADPASGATGGTAAAAHPIDAAVESALNPLAETLRETVEKFRPQVQEFAEKNLASLLQNVGVEASARQNPTPPSGNA